MVTQSTAGAGEWVFAKRDCNLVCTSSNWTGETVSIEYRAPGGEACSLKDSPTEVVAFTANDGRRVRGGLEYRMNKASTRTVAMELVESLAASAV
jgi:hypothetical protein